MRLLLSNNQFVDVSPSVYYSVMQGVLSTIQQASASSTSLPDLVHPEYSREINDWLKFRSVYRGGQQFLETYLKQFSSRENPADFARRKEVTPTPDFAAASVNEIKNSIFSRAIDIVRKGGPASYQRAVLGELNGVDLRGGTMNWFIGSQVLPQMLSMRKVGVYVDNYQISGSLADNVNKHPYLYIFEAEDIRSWEMGNNREFKSLLLRERVTVTDDTYGLPSGIETRFRRIYINSNGFVEYQIHDEEGNPTSDPQTLGITQIPFVTFELSASLLEHVANHQIALLNMESSDVAYALRANFPFYTEQRDMRGSSQYLKAAQATMKAYAGNETAAILTQGEVAQDNEIEAGATQGRYYPLGAERPGFIAPPTDPLEASMSKQKALKDDIRVLVHLALSNLQAKMASAESKTLDQQGLEAGLSYIGLELEHGESRIAYFWSMYERSMDVPTVSYPKKYSLKSTEEVLAEITKLRELRDDNPSVTYKREINKRIVELTMAATLPKAKLDAIFAEIEASDFTTTDPKILTQDYKDGVLDTMSYAKARNYTPAMVEQAKKDHAERLARIQEAQTSNDPAARGNPDASANPDAGADEKINKPKRGEGQ